MITEEAGTADLDSPCRTCQIDAVYEVVHSMMGRVMMLESRVRFLEQQLAQQRFERELTVGTATIECEQSE